MRFIINIVCFLFLLPLIATAQTYKYIGVENGLSNRRIFDIQKDSVGYMWFLTNEGIDRYNGKDIKHYKLIRQFGIKKCPKKLVISLLFCNFIVDNQLITNIYSDDYH